MIKKILLVSLLSIVVAACSAEDRVKNEVPDTAPKVKILGQQVIMLPASPDPNSAAVATFETIEDRDTRVLVQLNKSNSSVYPVSINSGTCEKPDAVRYPLNDMKNGNTDTRLNGTDLKPLQGLIIVLRAPDHPEQIATCAKIE